MAAFNHFRSGVTSRAAFHRDTRNFSFSQSGISTCTNSTRAGTRPFCASATHQLYMSCSVNSISVRSAFTNSKKNTSDRILWTFPEPYFPLLVFRPPVEMFATILPSVLTASNVNVPPEHSDTSFSEKS